MGKHKWRSGPAFFFLSFVFLFDLVRGAQQDEETKTKTSKPNLIGPKQIVFCYIFNNSLFE
jgi:hypothetical protein